MKVKAVKQFFDLKEKVRRNPGDEFEVTQARFKEINSTKNGLLVEELEEKPKTKKGK